MSLFDKFIKFLPDYVTEYRCDTPSIKPAYDAKFEPRYENGKKFSTYQIFPIKNDSNNYTPDNSLIIKSLNWRPIVGNAILNCKSNQIGNQLAPIIQYAPFEYVTISNDSKSIHEPDIAIIIGSMSQIPIKELVEIHSDFIPQSERHPLDILSHGQILRTQKTTGSSTLWGILFQFFDWQTVTLSNLLTLIIMLACSWIINENKWNKKWVLKTKNFLYNFAVWTSLYSGHSENFYETFFIPLFKIIKFPIAKFSVCFLSITILIWSRLFGEFFSADILVALIQEPIFYLNSASDFLRYRVEYNLTFISRDDSLKDLIYGEIKAISPAFDPALNKIAEKYDSTENFGLELLARARDSKTVLNVGIIGCDLFKILDPFWNSKNYHCMEQKVSPIWQGIAVYKRFREKMKNSKEKYRSTFRILRKISEAYLSRRLVSLDGIKYHLASMRASNFESQVEAKNISPLNIAAIDDILINTIYIFAFCILAKFFHVAILSSYYSLHKS